MGHKGGSRLGGHWARRGGLKVDVEGDSESVKKIGLGARDADASRAPRVLFHRIPSFLVIVVVTSSNSS
jgi:hypothetical protein